MGGLTWSHPAAASAFNDADARAHTNGEDLDSGSGADCGAGPLDDAAAEPGPLASHCCQDNEARDIYSQPNYSGCAIKRDGGSGRRL